MHGELITDPKRVNTYVYIMHICVHMYTFMQVFSVDNATCTRNLVGYILMDLRTAQIGGKVRPFDIPCSSRPFLFM